MREMNQVLSLCPRHPHPHCSVCRYFSILVKFSRSGPLIAEFPLDDISYFHDLVTISASNSQMIELCHKMLIDFRFEPSKIGDWSSDVLGPCQFRAPTLFPLPCHPLPPFAPRPFLLSLRLSTPSFSAHGCLDLSNSPRHGPSLCVCVCIALLPSYATSELQGHSGT